MTNPPIPTVAVIPGTGWVRFGVLLLALGCSAWYFIQLPGALQKSGLAVLEPSVFFFLWCLGAITLFAGMLGLHEGLHYAAYRLAGVPARVQVVRYKRYLTLGVDSDGATDRQQIVAALAPQILTIGGILAAIVGGPYGVLIGLPLAATNVGSSAHDLRLALSLL